MSFEYWKTADVRFLVSNCCSSNVNHLMILPACKWKNVDTLIYYHAHLLSCTIMITLLHLFWKKHKFYETKTTIVSVLISKCCWNNVNHLKILPPCKWKTYSLTYSYAHLLSCTNITTVLHLFQKKYEFLWTENHQCQIFNIKLLLK